ncbi:MAG TPA: (2Fe-2S)-binding protein [Bryobacterales bacterium]|nr:(2Fe-2S)-binding protein [Bryobacterales bacterium]
MSSKKTTEGPPETQQSNGFSRRTFIQGVGVGTGAAGALLTPEAEAAPPSGVVGPGPVSLTLKINGKNRSLEAEPRVTLLDALRNRLDITGAKKVCDRATCGSCTVIVDGHAVYACTMLAIEAQGREIRTIESLAANDPVPRNFVKHDAQQCGFCTPGFVMACQSFLENNPNPSQADVEAGLSGNICRCGTYAGVRMAALDAAKEVKGGRRG